MGDQGSLLLAGSLLLLLALAGAHVQGPPMLVGAGQDSVRQDAVASPISLRSSPHTRASQCWPLGRR